jgi:MFS family permease
MLFTAAVSPKTTFSHQILFTICLICYIGGGLVSTLMSVYLPVVVRELMGDVSEAELGRVSAYIGSVFLFGWMLGGIGFGFAGDSIGRVKAFTGAVLLYAVFTILTAFSTSWWMVIGCRFFAGIGVGGVLVLATVLVSEAWPAKTKNIALGILAIAFPIGIISAGAINNLVSNWREAFYVGCIPFGMAIIASLVLKESAQWKNMRTQAKLQARPGGFSQLLQPAHRKNVWIGSLIFGAMLVGLWAIFSWMPTWIQSLFPSQSLGQQERGITMMLLGSGGIIGGAISGFLSNAIGNRKTLLITFAGSFIMCLILFTTNSVFSKIIYLETALLALFFGISQGALSAYLPQLFPTFIRATATGFCFNIGRLATATVVFFVGTLVAVLGGYGNAVLAFSVTFVIGFVVTWFAKDVKIPASEGNG